MITKWCKTAQYICLEEMYINLKKVEVEKAHTAQLMAFDTGFYRSPNSSIRSAPRKDVATSWFKRNNKHCRQPVEQKSLRNTSILKLEFSRFCLFCHPERSAVKRGMRPTKAKWEEWKQSTVSWLLTPGLWVHTEFKWATKHLGETW